MSRRNFDPALAGTIVLTGVLLSACGGGGGGDSSGGSGGDDGTLKAGLYEATVEYTNDNPTQTATTYISPTGKFAIVFRGNTGISIGKLSFDDTTISGTSTDYRQVDSEGFIEEKGTDKGAISGTITSSESAEFSTSDSEGKVNTNVTLTRGDQETSLSDMGTSLKEAAGVYQTDDSEVVLTVYEDGSVDSQYYPEATDGCHLSGTEAKSVSVPDTSINIFDISYKMSNCGEDKRNKDYTGLGFIGPVDNQQMRMVFVAHSGEVAMRFSGIEQ